MNYTDTDSLPSRAELVQILLLFDKRIKTLEKKFSQIENRGTEDGLDFVSAPIVHSVPERAKKKYVYSKQDLLDLRAVGGIRISKFSTPLAGEFDSPRYADVVKTVSVPGGMTSARPDNCFRATNHSGFSFNMSGDANNN